MKLILKEGDDVIFEAEADKAGWYRLESLAQSVLLDFELFEDMKRSGDDSDPGFDTFDYKNR